MAWDPFGLDPHSTYPLPGPTRKERLVWLEKDGRRYSACVPVDRLVPSNRAVTLAPADPLGRVYWPGSDHHRAKWEPWRHE